MVNFNKIIDIKNWADLIINSCLFKGNIFIFLRVIINFKLGLEAISSWLDLIYPKRRGSQISEWYNLPINRIYIRR